MPRHYARELARSAHRVNHGTPTPNGTPAHVNWSDDQTLHVASVYSNPVRSEARRKLFNDFRRHMESLPNVRLYVGELAYGDRAFEVTSADHPDDLQLRTRHELWHKENVLNRVIEQFAPGWEYGAWVDGDVTFGRWDVGMETIHQLQHFDWVQMFSHYTDLGPDHQPLGTKPGFAYARDHGLDVAGRPIGRYGWPGSPGFAWAFRRGAFDAAGRLLDTCILGSADHHMAAGLVNMDDKHPDLHLCGDAYSRSIRIWRDRAFAASRGNVGYVKAHLTHGWHGPRRNRGYEWRWKILRDNQYDPTMDIFSDAQGIWQLTPEKPKLRDALRAYFRQRNEDDLSL